MKLLLLISAVSVGAIARAAVDSPPPRVMTSVLPLDRSASPRLEAAGIPRRIVAIDDQGLWPNLSVLNDGTIIASVFNRPNHGFTPGDIDCWASQDGGRHWIYRSTATRHGPGTNRMNCGAGVNQAGNLVVLCSGWDHLSPRREPKLSRPLHPTISISTDEGRTWEISERGMPPPVAGLSEHVPFGRILIAANGDLVAGTYAFDPSAHAAGRNRQVRGNLYALRSRDGGHTWPIVRPIVVGNHCEAAILNRGKGRWLAVGRRFAFTDLEAFASDDDAYTWHSLGVLGIPDVSSPDLLLLRDGRVLLTYGNRSPGAYGIDARLSGDGGVTWTPPQRLCDLDTGDCGYPMALEFPGGRIMVAYYSSGVVAHRRYHMGVLNFMLDELVIR